MRVVVIGTGSIGERHVRCFLATGRATVSICETNQELRARMASEYSIAGAYADLESAIAAGLDAAVICTPAQLHVPLARLLAEQGIATLIEKPLSTSIDGVGGLISITARTNLVVGVAYVLRLHPMLWEMRDAIRSGRFGEPVQVVGVSGQHFPFYRPAYREIYYRDRATGGGAIQDALTHLVNAGEWLVGPVTSLAADAAHQVLEGVEVEDTVHLIARHGPVMGNYALNQHQAPNETSLTVVCREGTARCELSRNRWLSAETPGSEWEVRSSRNLERDDLFIAQARAFLDAVEGRGVLACTLQEGAQTLRTNLAILKAAQTRSWQSISGNGD